MTAKPLKLIVKPIGGLGNRMRAVASAIQLSFHMQIPLTILWARARETNCNFHDLFIPIKKIEILDISQIKILLRYGAVHGYTLPIIHRLFYQNHFISNSAIVYAGKDSQTLLEQCKKRSLFIETCESFFPVNPPLSFFKPTPALSHRIEDATKGFNEHTVGVHIRRTDNKLSIQHSPLPLFLKAMDHLIDTEPSTSFYLATDCLETKQHLVKLYRNRIISTDKPVIRNTLSGMEDALVEMYCLSKTNLILASYWSSFSTVAGLLSNIPVKTIRTKIQ